jgi:hypothetical protein
MKTRLHPGIKPASVSCPKEIHPEPSIAVRLLTAEQSLLLREERNILRLKAAFRLRDMLWKNTIEFRFIFFRQNNIHY